MLRASSRRFSLPWGSPAARLRGGVNCELVHDASSPTREAPRLDRGEESIVSLSSREVTIPGGERRGLKGSPGAGLRGGVSSWLVRRPLLPLRGSPGAGLRGGFAWSASGAAYPFPGDAPWFGRRGGVRVHAHSEERNDPRSRPWRAIYTGCARWRHTFRRYRLCFESKALPVARNGSNESPRGEPLFVMRMETMLWKLSSIRRSARSSLG